MFPAAPIHLPGGDPRWPQEVVDEWVDTRRCDGDRSPPRRQRDRGTGARIVTLPSPREPRARSASARRAPVPSPARRVQGTATRPHRSLPPPRRRAERHRRKACDTETNPRGGHAGRADRGKQERADARDRRSQAERAGGRSGGGLGRHHPSSGSSSGHCHGIDNEVRRALAATEPLAGTVQDAVMAAIVEHACTTHDGRRNAGVDRSRPRPSGNGPACTDADGSSAALRLPTRRRPSSRHNTFIEPRNLDERGERPPSRRRSRERGSSSCSTGRREAEAG